MNLKPEKKPAHGKPPHSAASTKAAGPAKPRPARRLFQPQAKPLESGVTPLLSVRSLRRNTRPLAVLAVCLALGGACRAQDANPADEALAVTNRAELEDMVERSAALIAEQMLQTNDITLSNAVGEASIPRRTQGVAVAASPSVSSARDSEESRRRSSRDRDRDRDGSDSSRDRDRSSAPSSSSSSSRSAQLPSKSVASFSEFALIGDRNIFDPNRNPRRSGNDEQRPKQRVVDSFGLVGVMAYEKGTFAFFDGSASEYKKVLKLFDEIAGYKLIGIEPNAVKLRGSGRNLEMRVGSQMRREEGGDWAVSDQRQTYAATPAPGAPPATSTSAPSGPPGSSDDILKRLMQRREQE